MRYAVIQGYLISNILYLISLGKGIKKSHPLKIRGGIQKYSTVPPWLLCEQSHSLGAFRKKDFLSGGERFQFKASHKTEGILCVFRGFCGEALD